jgi:hypothetical protein
VIRMPGTKTVAVRFERFEVDVVHPEMFHVS